MTPEDANARQPAPPQRTIRPERPRRSELVAIAFIFAVAVWFYFWSAGASVSAWTDRAAASYYALQTEAFMAGQLHLKLEPHPQLLLLPDPYDPIANAPYRVHDMSLYDGKYFVYFGVTPILVLLWPWRALTGTYLTEPFMVALFGAAGLAICLLLLIQVRRRLFPGASTAVVVAGAGVLALGNLVPGLMQAPNFYQVPMTCAYFFGAVAVTAAFRSLFASTRASTWWLAGASLAWGLAVAARPNYLLGSALLLVPVAWRLGWSREWKIWLRPGSLRLLAAAVVPLALVGAALMAYNHARFGAVTEFGMKYQLASFRIADQRLMGLGHLIPNLWSYLFTVPQWSRYFPFIIPGADQQPLGALSVFPFFWLGVIALVRFYRRPELWRTEAGALALLVAVPAIAILLFLSLYFAVILRYATDFILWMAMGSTGAALLFDQEIALHRPRWRRWFRLLVGLLALMAVVVTVTYSLRLFADPARLSTLARLANYPSHLWARFTGQVYGPIHLEVTFPMGRSGTTEPLVSTGVSRGQTDLVFVRYLSGDRVQFGFFHSGLGGPTSEPLRLPPGPQRLEIFLGSFLPPEEHPFFDGWAPLSVAGVRRQMELRLNGESVLETAAQFYPSSPGDLAIGANPHGIGDIAPRFHGTIAHVEQRPIDAEAYRPPDLAADQPVQMRLFFPTNREGSPEPLIQTGTRGTSDLLYVSYLSQNRVAFGLDHWGGGGPLSEAVEIDPNRQHELLVWLGPFSEGRADAAEPAPERGTVAPERRLFVSLNGRVMLDADQPFYPATMDQVVVGLNPGRHSSAGSMFSGRMASYESADAAELPPSPRWHGYGDVRMVLSFPRGMTGQAEPLVTTGVTGAGDFIYVRYVDDHHIRIGLDHWMYGGAESELLPVNYDVPHRIEIVMDALLPPEAPRSGKVQVRLDGRTVLDTQSPHHPTTAEQIRVGVNAIGGSTTSARFTGRILVLRRNAPLP